MAVKKVLERGPTHGTACVGMQHQPTNLNLGNLKLRVNLKVKAPLQPSVNSCMNFASFEEHVQAVCRQAVGSQLGHPSEGWTSFPQS